MRRTRPLSAPVWEPWAAPTVLLVYLAIASWVALVAHRAPGYGVETDLLTDFAPGARALLAGKLEASLYQFHGFGYPALLAAASLPAGGDFFLAARALNLVAAGAGLWFAHALFRAYGGARMGLFVVLGLAVNPAFWTYTVEAGTDMPAFALLMGATCGALLGRAPWALAAAGLAAGLAYTTRYNAVAVLAASTLVLLGRRDPKRLALYAVSAAVPIGAWLVANAAIAGHPFFSRNYLNVAFAAYGAQAPWDAFMARVGHQFHSLGEVVRYDPAAFARGIGTHLATHWLRDARELLPWWLGLPGVLGVAALWGMRPGWRGLAVHFALTYLALGFVFYNVRFFLYLLPFYLAGAAALLFPAAAAHGPRVARWLSLSPFARQPGLAWAAAALAFAFSAASARDVVREELSKDPLDVRFAGETLKRLGPKDGIVMARKPHVPFYAGMRLLRFPPEGTLRGLLLEAKRADADYVLYSGMEASLRPEFLMLMDPGVGFPGFEQIERRVVNAGNYYALYRVSDAPVDSAALDSALYAALLRFQAAHLNESAAHYDVGSQFLDLGRTAEALDQLVIASRLQPNLVQAVMLEAEANRRLGRFAAAREAVERARAVGATDAWKEAKLGEIDLAAGRAQDAGRHLSRAVALEPTNMATLRLLLEAQEAGGDSAGAAGTRARIARLSRRES